MKVHVVMPDLQAPHALVQLSVQLSYMSRKRPALIVDQVM